MAGERQPRPLAPTEFTPLDAAASRRRFRISPVYLGLGIVVALAALSLGYLLAARAVIFDLEPVDAALHVSGISFHIGDNFLLLPGSHQVTAEADGYHPLTTTIDVTAERTQEVELVSDTYYEDALRHDADMVARQRTDALGDAFTIVPRRDAGDVVIHWPREMAPLVRGEAVLYRPSSARGTRMLFSR